MKCLCKYNFECNVCWAFVIIQRKRKKKTQAFSFLDIRKRQSKLPDEYNIGKNFARKEITEFEPKNKKEMNEFIQKFHLKIKLKRVINEFVTNLGYLYVNY